LKEIGVRNVEPISSYATIAKNSIRKTRSVF
jgi:hypothetical protein